MKKIGSACVSAALVAVLTAGCASVPMASSDMDMQVKQFYVPPGKSRIYVYRNEYMGGALKTMITLDGKVVGSTAPKTYFALDVTPGKYVLGCIVQQNTDSLSVNATAGKSVFVWQEMKLGTWSPSCALNLMDDHAGRNGVMESRLAQTGQ